MGGREREKRVDDVVVGRVSITEGDGWMEVFYRLKSCKKEELSSLMCRLCPPILRADERNWRTLNTAPEQTRLLIFSHH